MIILAIISVIFLGFAIKGLFRPIDDNRFDVYFFVMLAIAIGIASFPARHWYFEYSMARGVEKLINRDNVVVKCQSYFDSLYTYGMAGFVYRGKTVIYLDPKRCNQLKDYVSGPKLYNDRNAYALHVLTHEAMHVAGEYNEMKTDCKAFQRNHKMAMILGVERDIAIRTAIDLHRFRSPRHPYYSSQCEPGTEWDEKLADAVWVGP